MQYVRMHEFHLYCSELIFLVLYFVSFSNGRYLNLPDILKTNKKKIDNKIILKSIRFVK